MALTSGGGRKLLKRQKPTKFNLGNFGGIRGEANTPRWAPETEDKLPPVDTKRMRAAIVRRINRNNGTL